MGDETVICQVLLISSHPKTVLRSGDVGTRNHDRSHARTLDRAAVACCVHVRIHSRNSPGAVGRGARGKPIPLCLIADSSQRPGVSALPGCMKREDAGI